MVVPGLSDSYTINASLQVNDWTEITQEIDISNQYLIHYTYNVAGFGILVPEPILLYIIFFVTLQSDKKYVYVINNPIFADERACNLFHLATSLIAYLS